VGNQAGHASAGEKSLPEEHSGVGVYRVPTVGGRAEESQTFLLTVRTFVLKPFPARAGVGKRKGRRGKSWKNVWSRGGRGRGSCRERAGRKKNREFHGHQGYVGGRGVFSTRRWSMERVGDRRTEGG